MWVVMLSLLLQDTERKCHLRLDDVQVAGSRFEKGIRFDAVAANLSASPLKDVEIEVTIDGRRKLPKFTAAEIPARRGVAVAILERDAEQFTSYRVKVTYALDGKKDSFEYGCSDPKKDPVLEGGVFPKEEGAGVRAGIAGLKGFGGAYVDKGGQRLKWSGDTLFLRVRVDNMNPKLEGSFEIKVAYEGKPLGTFTRNVSTAHWKVDAAKIPEQNPDVKIIAWDASKKELLVGLFKIEEERDASKLRLDVKLKLGSEKWMWEKLDAPWLELPKAGGKK